MSIRWVWTIAVLAVVIVMVGCAGNSTPPETSPSPGSPADPATGAAVFTMNCATCHGQDGKGMPGLGKDLTTSAWVDDRTDEELMEFILTGRPASDPLNTTGVDMPPKGGNPALTEQDIEDIIAYVRSIHE